jgi:hypothetical protein
MGIADGMDPIRCLDKQGNFHYQYGSVNVPFEGKVNRYGLMYSLYAYNITCILQLVIIADSKPT